MNNFTSKILIVDDNIFYLSLLKTILKDVDATVYKASSGKEALSLIQENEFALNILDIQMPEMDGFELATRIRNLPGRDLEPIIFLTAYFSDEIQMFKGYDYGAIDYLTKPVNKSVFISKVRIFLELDLQKRNLIASNVSILKSKIELEEKQSELELKNRELQKAQKEIKESEELYHSLLTTSPDGIIVTDLKGRITDVSDIGLNLFGNMSSEVKGKNVVQFIPRNSWRKYVKLFKTIREEGMAQNVEITLNRINNTEFTGEVSVSQIKDNDRRIKAFMAVIRDISERKLIEKRLRHSERMAGIGELAAGMAHEINQPLNIISLSVDNIMFSLKNNTLTETYLKTKIDKVFSNITRIKNIIDHVRTFSRDHDDFILSNFEVNKSIKNSISMISEQFSHKDINLSFIPGKNIPKLKGNSNRFEQVMLNMLINAKDAIEEKKKKQSKNFRKTIEISTKVIDKQVIIEINDNGSGIRPEDIEKVLLPFYTTKPPGKGTGLGLSISYGIIKELGGDIEIQSNLQIGTTILIKIPFQETKTAQHYASPV